MARHDTQCERSEESPFCSCAFRAVDTTIRPQPGEQPEPEERELIAADVLLSSGDVDEWADIVDAVVDVDLGGSLVVLGPEKVAAIYAPGMWMKVEYK